MNLMNPTFVNRINLYAFTSDVHAPRIGAFCWPRGQATSQSNDMFRDGLGTWFANLEYGESVDRDCSASAPQDFDFAPQTTRCRVAYN